MIKIKNASKCIKGNMVLNNITYCFEEGRIYGLYGRNASGKTMLIRLIAGLIAPTDGSVEISGKVLHRDIDFPESVGVLIESPNFWDYYTGREVMRTLARIKGVAGDADIAAAMKRVGLVPDDKRLLRQYSLGMRQKLGIAQAIMEHPDILLLDEPTNALDREAVIGVRKILKEEAERGAVVIVASHNKEDLDMCDCLLEMDQGNLIAD